MFTFVENSHINRVMQTTYVSFFVTWIKYDILVTVLYFYTHENFDLGIGLSIEE